jgi:DNA-binding NarL/FixJ family response regulator
MSDAKGSDAVIRLRESYPDMPVVIFSGDESTQTMKMAFEHGVLGYIPKSSSVPQIINAIKLVLDGSSYIPSKFMRALGYDPPTRQRRAQLDEPAVPKLTPRQQDVLGYLLQGMPNKVIAERLGMAEGTVKTHLYTIYRLFGANNRAQVILRASQLGLV